MVISYEKVSPSPISNAVVQKMFVDGLHKRYVIGAEKGYVLHDNRCDEEEINLETLVPTGETIYRYATGTLTVNADYDFSSVKSHGLEDKDGNPITVCKVGSFELFTLPAVLVKKEQIYGKVE